MSEPIQILAFVLVNAIAVGAAAPQTGNLKSPVRVKRISARLVVVFCATYVLGWSFSAGHLIPEYVAGPTIFLSAVTAFAAWSAGMVWGGPATRFDRLTFLCAGTAILLLLSVAVLGALDD